MLTIRFARVGKKNKAQFKIVLQERTVAPGGRHVEILGSYNPHLRQAVLKEERIKYWLGKGAHSSDTVYNLLVSKKLIFGKKRAVKMPAKKTEVAKPEEKTEVKKEEKPVEKLKEDANKETEINLSAGEAEKQEAKE